MIFDLIDKRKLKFVNVTDKDIENELVDTKLSLNNLHK